MGNDLSILLREWVTISCRHISSLHQRPCSHFSGANVLNKSNYVAFCSAFYRLCPFGLGTRKSCYCKDDRAMRPIYEGRSINKLKNGAIPSVLVGNLILNIHTTLLDDYVIIVTSSDNRTQSICVLFSPSVYCPNSQVTNSARMTEKNEKA